jgi:hypothetical protein
MATNTFSSTSTQLSTTNTTTIYQAPGTAGNVGVVLSVMVANVNGTASADITVSKTTSGDALQSHLVYTVPVPPDTSLEIISNRIILRAGEKLRAVSQIANYHHVTVSVLEIT